ncbi:MAG: serine--tRNA ligase [Bacillota bacterium]|jgi:seryl-tRNA synthetase
MLDIKLLREDLAGVRQKLQHRGESLIGLEKFQALDQEHRALLGKVEKMRHERKTASLAIANKRREQEDSSIDEKNVRLLGEEIKEYEEQLREQATRLNDLLLALPNIPAPDVPIGESAADNVVVEEVDSEKRPGYPVLPHWEVAQNLGILDFQRASAVAGARFVFYCGPGALLERALKNFMLDLHTKEHGYTEIFVPFLVNEASMYGTGQLPKFGEDVFKLADQGLYLIPTAETPLTNYHRGEILAASELPKKYVSYSSCFRSEAGAAGRDTRGLIRLHQFQKVELLKLVTKEQAEEEYQKLLKDAERVLRLLKLPYRRLLMCTGDLGFQAQKKYDLEVWMPAKQAYCEISSCSHFGDFQARRANIRYRSEAQSKPKYLHTINGSGLALGRTVAAILENYQEPDGSVRVPDCLRAYMGGLDVMKSH